MNDDDRMLPGLTSGEEDLARTLVRLGPVMREQEQAEADLDRDFARKLRAHLVLGEELTSDWVQAQNLQGRLLRERSARPIPGKPGRQPIVWIGGTTTALMAVIAAVLLAVLRSQSPSFSAPYPTQADLLFSFPAPATIIHRLTPTASLVHPRSGIPYAGHLRLSARRLPQAAPTLKAYRLAAPVNVVPLGRRLLGIYSPVHQVVAGSAVWSVAADGGYPSRRPLHSLAVSRASGELIYHDRRNLALPRSTRALPRSIAVRVARHWLTLLGWPGGRMPLAAVKRVPHMRNVREVEFGWIGVGASATDAATLWVTPNRSVIEAWVWPPVVRGGTVAVRSIKAAWTEVQAGKLPLAVEGVSPTSRANGRGSVRDTRVVAILSGGRRGAVYLVPTYRFEGTAHLQGASVHTWYSLVPSAGK